MKILITGATGFLGRRAVEILSQQHQVIAVGRNQSIGHSLNSAAVQFFACDLTQEHAVLNLPNDFDMIVHSAALSSPWGKWQDFYTSNVIATQNLIKLAQSSQQFKRFIHISTPSVYFDYSDRFNIKETDQVADPAPCFYTKSKLMAENDLLNLHQRQQFPVIILRPRGLFGPGDTSIIPRLIKAKESGRLPIIGDGKNITDLTYVDNVVDAISCSINAEEKVHGEIFNITNGEPTKLWDFLGSVLVDIGLTPPQQKLPFPLIFGISLISELICKLLPFDREPALTRYTTGLLAKSQTLDISKARDMLKYKPKVSLAEGRNLTIKWWKDTNVSKGTNSL
jgi:nucleoside-diphosphate-sugar epimerase